jgi:hypothetical protein
MSSDSESSLTMIYARHSAFITLPGSLYCVVSIILPTPYSLGAGAAWTSSLSRSNNRSNSIRSSTPSPSVLFKRPGALPYQLPGSRQHFSKIKRRIVLARFVRGQQLTGGLLGHIVGTAWSRRYLNIELLKDQ